MRALQVRNLALRDVTLFDVVVQLMFGGKAPTAFDPNKYYYAGDLVYIQNPDGTLTIMQANGNGIFSECAEPNWSEYTLTSILNKQTEMIKELTGIRSKISDQIYNVHTLMYPLTKGTLSIRDLGVSEWQNDYSYTEIFVDAQYVSKDFWTLEGDVLTFDGDYATSHLTKDVTVTIRVNEANSLLARMVRRIEGRVVSKTIDNVEIPYPIDPTLIDMKFDLYLNGNYIPSTTFTIDTSTGKPIIKWNGSMTGEEGSYEFIFAFAYSISNELVLLRSDYVNSIDDIYESYQLDLTENDFINSFQEIKVFLNSKLMDAGRYVISSGYVNMTKEDYYLAEGDIVYAPIWSYVLMDYEVGEVRHNSQSSPIYLDATKRSPIPFLAWEPASDGLMIFNDAGIRISDTKWYVDGYDIQYFEHDLGLSNGDILDFRLLYEDSSVKMQNFYFSVASDNSRSFNLSVDLSKYNFVMVFSVTGQYFDSSRYSIKGNTITFTNDVVLLKDDRIHITAFKYKSTSTSTSFDRLIVSATSSNQTNVSIPFSDYNQGTDSLLLFNKKGEYIGERYYTINDNNTIDLLCTPLDVSISDYMEFVLFRNLTITVSAEGV